MGPQRQSRLVTLVTAVTFILPHTVVLTSETYIVKLLGLAGGNTKKRGNNKSGESITPIRYNIIPMY